MAYATIQELESEIASELKIELSTLGEVIPDDTVLALKVRDAVRETVRERNYPEEYTDEMILADIVRFYPNIKAKSIYKGNLIGAEMQKSHSENGTNRVWIEYERLSNGIIPIARIS